jgi:hypothetical protein
MLALIEEDKAKYNQRTFPTVEGTGVCGGVFCAAGFLILAKSQRLFTKLCKLTDKYQHDGTQYDVHTHTPWFVWGHSAGQLLKITAHEEHTLFGLPGEWPEKFYEMYDAAKYRATERGQINARYKALKARWVHWLKESDKALGIS